MVTAENREIINAIKKQDPRCDVLNDLLGMCAKVYDEDNTEIAYCLKITNYIKDCILYLGESEDLKRLYWDVLLFEAPHLFESFLYYMEKNRDSKRKFYEPRRKTLKVVVDDLQELEEGKIEFYGLSLPARTGKSTICIFFLAWVAGRSPNKHNAMGGHSGLLAKGFYKEFNNLISTAEYTYNEIFPKVKLESKSADEFTVNLDKPDRFATLTCRGIDGTWTGAVDVSAGAYLYVDDLIRDRTESLSAIRLENRYQDYLNVMVDRKNDGAKELMVATRWNVMDPLGKTEAKYKDNQKYRFRKIPALNENDESNFDYDCGVGFSTEYYKNLRDRLDKNEWMAKYQQQPFIREGLLFPADELRYYNGVLPDGDYRVVTACDVAWGGGDSLSMPIGYEYENGDVYIVDWIFSRGKKEITMPKVVGKILQHEIRRVVFEGNSGGDMYADKISERLLEHEYKCSCVSKKAPSRISKMEKIVAYSGEIINRFIFLDESHREQEYRDAMNELNMTVQIGKNEHEDAADGLTQVAMVMEGRSVATVEACINPYRRL